MEKKNTIFEKIRPSHKHCKDDTYIYVTSIEENWVSYIYISLSSNS